MLSLLLQSGVMHHYYQYNVSLAASIVFTVFFGITSIVLLLQSIKSRTLFMLWVVICSLMEMGGYIARIELIELMNRNSYLAQLIIIILAPNLISLVNYIVVGRILQYGELPEKSYWARHPQYIPRFFVCSDLMGLTLQGMLYC